MTSQSLTGDRNNLGRRIAREREIRGWSLNELARRIEALVEDESDDGKRARIHARTVARFESGDQPLKVHELVAVSRVFGLPVQELLRPIELVDDERAAELYEARKGAIDGILESVNRLVETELELWREAQLNRGVYDWVRGKTNLYASRIEGDDDPADRLHILHYAPVKVATMKLLEAVLDEYVPHLVTGSTDPLGDAFEAWKEARHGEH